MSCCLDLLSHPVLPTPTPSQVEAPSTLPGWGMWAGAQREPRWMRDAKVKAERDRANAAAGRTDAKMRNVVISEKWDKKAAKYSAGSLPFPYDSKEVYESSIRQPLGREVREGEGELGQLSGRGHQIIIKARVGPGSNHGSTGRGLIFLFVFRALCPALCPVLPHQLC